jgi:hypothetical protein
LAALVLTLCVEAQEKPLPDPVFPFGAVYFRVAARAFSGSCNRIASQIPLPGAAPPAEPGRTRIDTDAHRFRVKSAPWQKSAIHA